MCTCYTWIFAFMQKHRQLILWLFFTLDKAVDMWLLKAVYMYSVYLKFCKLEVKTVCVLKFTVYNVKDFIYYRKYKTSKTFCVRFIFGAGSLHCWNTPFPSMLNPFEVEHCKVYFTSSTNPIEISIGKCHYRNNYLI